MNHIGNFRFLNSLVKSEKKQVQIILGIYFVEPSIFQIFSFQHVIKIINVIYSFINLWLPLMVIQSHLIWGPAQSGHACRAPSWFPWTTQESDQCPKQITLPHPTVKWMMLLVRTTLHCY